jgi:hypothetical protein
MNFSEISVIFDNNIFFKWITPGVSGSFRGGDKPVNYQNKTFSQPAVFKKKFRRQSESQPRFFGEMIPGRPKNGEFDTWIVINGTKTNSYHHQNDEYIWAMVIKQTDINT